MVTRVDQFCLEIIEEPQGDIYRRLIALAARNCDRFYLVWWEQLTFNENADGIVVELSRWFLREETTDTWDGTLLFGHFAKLRHYELCAESADILTRVGRLYAWLAPDLPEDLTFYTSDGALWMASVSHECGAGFDGRWVSTAYLNRHIPEIELVEFPRAVGFIERPIGNVTGGEGADEIRTLPPG
ncbi:MAG: hypothetical protein H8F28_01500 [Fibrella sp.]|nr:hypothetical protein [Armatimonadota bacterium]